MLKITNTLTGKKEPFNPIVPGKVSMYVCGVTPYDRSHVGHGRCYVSFDVLYRLLQLLEYTVTYVRNFTDIDDKLLHRAQQQFSDKMRYHELAQIFMNSFEHDMDALNCKKPTLEPCVTENMSTIIDFIEGLVASGYAYHVQGDVYFDVRKFEEYGTLSKQKIDDLCAGLRLEVNDKKRDVLDFALWKHEQESTFWHSPWGNGRPGWHIECSALVKKFLPGTIDIHGGGLDLIFPHHENEIAQFEALCQQPFVRYWVHNGLVKYGKEKMSKSLGATIVLADLFKQIDPMIVRFYFLTHHYRNPLDFSLEHMKTVQKTYQRLVALCGHDDGASYTLNELHRMPVLNQMIDFLCDDLNTPGMLGVVFEHAHIIKQDTNMQSAIRWLFKHVLGLTLDTIEQDLSITPEIQALINQRTQARLAKNWTLADALRARLQELGFEVQDEKL